MLLNFSQAEKMEERQKIEGSLWDEFGAEYEAVEDVPVREFLAFKVCLQNNR